MKIKLIEFRPEHVKEILEKNAREEELLDLSGVPLEELVKRLPKETAWTGVVEEGIVGCGGVVIDRVMRKGIAWLFLSGLFYANLRPSIKAIRGKLKGLEEEFQLQRVELFAVEGRPKAIRFAEFLGFEVEGLLRNYGPEGQNVVVMGRVRDGS